MKFQLSLSAALAIATTVVEATLLRGSTQIGQNSADYDQAVPMQLAQVDRTAIGEGSEAIVQEYAGREALTCDDEYGMHCVASTWVGDLPEEGELFDIDTPIEFEREAREVAEPEPIVPEREARNSDNTEVIDFWDFWNNQLAY